MARQAGGQDVTRRLRQLAAGRCNDAVKLIFAEAPAADFIDGLDLSQLSEIKRGANGSVEIKLYDRIRALELLGELVGAGGGEKAAGFFRALDEAARKCADT